MQAFRTVYHRSAPARSAKKEMKFFTYKLTGINPVPIVNRDKIDCMCETPRFKANNDAVVSQNWV